MRDCHIYKSANKNDAPQKINNLFNTSIHRSIYRNPIEGAYVFFFVASVKYFRVNEPCCLCALPVTISTHQPLYRTALQTLQMI